MRSRRLDAPCAECGIHNLGMTSTTPAVPRKSTQCSAFRNLFDDMLVVSMCDYVGF